MPFSSDYGKAHIKRIVNRIKPKTALDIGCGVGTYAKLFPHLEWTGVEIWKPYIEKYDLETLYPTLHNLDAREWDSDQHYDVAFLGDVLEHMTSAEARFLFEKMKKCSETVIISIPIGYLPQDEWEGNPYERHVTDNWTVDEFHSVFGESQWHVVEGFIGVFVYTPRNVALKIAVYAISKNEAHFIPRFCESAAEADLIVIADTGSDDGLPDVARQYGAVVHDICITPWRFDLARNAALALIPRDVDVCISLDIDEVLQPGWRQEIERVWTGDTTRLRYKFDWGLDIVFYYEKIHARHGYMWHHPCHEYPITDGRITEVWAHTDMLLAVHMPDPTKSRGQYMDLLELSVKEDPRCPRNAFYYARELSFNERWEQAIEAIEKYLKMPEAAWPNERSYAMRVAGKCWEGLGNKQEAEKWYLLAAAEAPNTREPWCQLALLMHHQQRWDECYLYSIRALKIEHRELLYTCDPTTWGHWAHDLASISAWQLGLKDVALAQAKLAVEKSPEDSRLLENLKWIETATKKQGIPNIVHMMWFVTPKSREFSFVNYLAVKRAAEIQKPDTFFFYYNQDIKNNPHWDAIKPFVTMIKIDLLDSYQGVPLTDWPQYQADLVRLQKLHEHGGIYLDTDSIMLKPFGDLMKCEAVISADIEGVTGADENGVQTVNAGVLLSRPRSAFIGAWLDEFAEGLRKGLDSWAWQVVNLPIEITKKNLDKVLVLPMKKFLPFGFYEYWVLETDNVDVNMERLKDCYAIHMWDSMWMDRLKEINAAYIETVDNPFTRVVK